MASVAERKRRKKISTAAAARARPIGAAAQSRPRAKTPYQRHKTGLEWLRDKGKLAPSEFKAGERYGSYHRTACIEGTISMRSSLDTDGVAGGGALSAPGLTVLGAAEWIAEARAELAAAHAALGYHSGMIAACELICGRGMTPREITDVQREAEEIENGLRIALQLLAKHWVI